METPATKARAFVLSLGVHVLCVLLMVVGLSWTRTARPVSVPGPIIEATLVSYTPPPRPASKRPPAKPVKPTPPKPEPKPVEAPLPPAPPRADDTIERERIDRMALEAAENAEREQEERHKREQELLEADQLTRMERERQEQLEDIRRQREEAQKRREREERQLALLEERENEARSERERMDELLEQEATPRAGTEGLDESLLARYVFTLQQIVTQNWLRPDTAAPGLKCTVRIVQIPGGEVLSASVVPPCNGDELTRRSLEAAVLRAQPLPYQGYESVFSRSVDFVFHYDG